MEEPVNELIRRAQQRQAKAIQVLVNGLNTDGAHHKQWCIAEALRIIIGDEQYAVIRRGVEAEDGIEP